MADEIGLLRRFIDEIPGPSTDAWARARAAIAAAGAEEEPAGRRPGRRQMFPVVGGLALAAAVAVLLAVVLPGLPTGPGRRVSTGQVRETAYVVNRVRDTLSASGQDNLVGYARTVYPAATGHGLAVTATREGLSLGAGRGAASRWNVGSIASWSYRGTTTSTAYTPAGTRVFEERSTFPSGRGGTVITVIYPSAAWWRARVTPHSDKLAPPRCGPDVQIGAGGWPALLRTDLGCGDYRVDGRQRVDGIDAIKLTGNGTSVLWVNPAAYLPVRAVSAVGGR